MYPLSLGFAGKFHGFSGLADEIRAKFLKAIDPNRKFLILSEFQDETIAFHAAALGLFFF
jgi:hypothetical protein